MSIFGRIASAIFGHRSTDSRAASGESSGSAGAAPGAPSSSAAPGSSTSSAAPGTSTGDTPTTSSAERSPSITPTGDEAMPTGQPMSRDDVEVIITQIAVDTGREEYNWDESIVDLMKLLDLDSSLAARKDLARELGYTGALDGSPEMNIWLHRQVMDRLAACGGRVPAELM